MRKQASRRGHLASTKKNKNTKTQTNITQGQIKASFISPSTQVTINGGRTTTFLGCPQIYQKVGDNSGGERITNS